MSLQKQDFPGWDFKCPHFLRWLTNRWFVTKGMGETDHHLLSFCSKNTKSKDFLCTLFKSVCHQPHWHFARLMPSTHLIIYPIPLDAGQFQSQNYPIPYILACFYPATATSTPNSNVKSSCPLELQLDRLHTVWIDSHVSAGFLTMYFFITRGACNKLKLDHVNQ